MLYAAHVASCFDEPTNQAVKHIAVDAYYTKLNVVRVICAGDFHLVGKLRKDAQLQWKQSDVSSDPHSQDNF